MFGQVDNLFKAVPGVNHVEPFAFGRYENQYSIDLHTRYLTERRHVDDQAHIPFPADVDPNQALDEARGSRFIRVQDNVVQYSKLAITEAGERRYVVQNFPTRRFLNKD